MRGGSGRGQGRKPKVEEEKAVALIRKAVQEVYGGEKEFVQAQLAAGEPAIIKFFLEHLFGKPKDRMDVTSDGLPVIWNEMKNYKKG